MQVWCQSREEVWLLDPSGSLIRRIWNFLEKLSMGITWYWRIKLSTESQHDFRRLKICKLTWQFWNHLRYSAARNVTLSSKGKGNHHGNQKWHCRLEYNWRTNLLNVRIDKMLEKFCPQVATGKSSMTLFGLSTTVLYGQSWPPIFSPSI